MGKKCKEDFLAVEADKEQTAQLYEKLVPGDILMTRTYGFFYDLWRKLSCTPYDHTAVVMENNETMNIVYPVAIRLPASHFFERDKMPAVMRPVWRSGKQLSDFLDGFRQLEGRRYNSFRGFFNVSNMMLYYQLGLKIPLKVPEMKAKRWVCTDAILMYLISAIPEFDAVRKLDLDVFRFGFTSPSDFLRIAHYMPDLLIRLD